MMYKCEKCGKEVNEIIEGRIEDEGVLLCEECFIRKQGYYPFVPGLTIG